MPTWRWSVVGLALAGLIAGLARAAPATPPDTPATRQVLKLLAMAHDPKADARAFVALVDPPPGSPPGPPPAGVRPPMLDVLAQMEPHGFASATETEADLVAFYPDYQNWAHLRVVVDVAEPHRIRMLGLSVGPAPAGVPRQPPLAPLELAAALRAHIAAEAQADRFAGAVLVARHGHVVFQGVYGLADREAKIPNTIDTQFRFGSMGKMFTAVAVMQLVQAGKLDLKAPLGTYLKDYPNAEVAKVTLDQLLTHTGGTGDIFGPDFTAHRLELHDAKDYLALYGARAPLFAPGSQQRYSNYGFMLLGRIVEVASGQSYDDYLQAHIFGPAGMTATGNLPEMASLLKRSVSYMKARDGLQRADDTLPYRGTPAGGGYSTVSDFLRFAAALMDHRLLDAQRLRLLTEGGVIGPDGKPISYDFAGHTSEGLRYFGHSGGAPGMNGELRIFPDNGYVVVSLANRDPPVAEAEVNFVSARLPASD